MKLNGNLVLNFDATGEIQHVYLERLTTTARTSLSLGAGNKGRVVFDTTDNSYYYWDGSAWVQFSTGGSISALQTEVDNIETAVGLNTNGTFSTTPYSGATYITSPTSVANAIMQLDAAINSNNTLAELDDVTLTAPASGHILYYNGSLWVNASPGATSGVQPYDAALASIAGLTTSANQMIYTTASDTYATTSLTAFARTLLDDATQGDMQTTLGLVPGTNVQAWDDGLQDLANLATTGIVVSAAADNYITRNILESTAAGFQGIDVSNGSGVSGDPTIGLDINGLTAEAGTPSGTDVLPMFDGVNNVKVSVSQLKAGIVGAGISIGDLSDVNDTTGSPGTAGQHYAFYSDGSEFHLQTLQLGDMGDVDDLAAKTLDAPVIFMGDGTNFDTVQLIVGTDISGVAVTGTSYTLNVDDVFLRNTGDTLDSGTLSIASSAAVNVLTGAQISWPDTPTSPNHLTNKAYVDNLVTAGTVWRDPIIDPDLQDVVSAMPTPSGSVGDTFTYIKYGGTQNETWGTVTNVVDNDVLVFEITTAPSTGTWTRIDTLDAGDRFVLAAEHGNVATTSNLYAAGFRSMDLIEYVSGNPTLYASWSKPHVSNYQTVHFTVNKAAGDNTGLADSTTYYFKVKKNTGAMTEYSITTDGTGPHTFTDLVGLLNTALTGISVTTSIADGHLHFTGSASSDVIIVDDGTTTPKLFSSLTDFYRIHGSVQEGTTVLDNDPDSPHYSHTYTFTTQNDTWAEIAGPGSIPAGTGLSYTGNTLNVLLGAGIQELPSDEVGLHLYASNNPLLLTTDGSTPSTATGAMLHLRYDNSTIGVNGSTQLYVPNAGITATQLNTSVAGLGIAGGGGTALSFAPVELTEVAITTSDHVVFEDVSDSNNPKKRAAGSLISDLSLLTTTALSGTDGVKYTSGTGVIELDIAALGGTTAVDGTDTMVFADNDGGTHIKRTITNFLADMDIVTASADGILVRTAADTYASRSVAVEGVGNLDGLAVSNGDGVSGNPTIGLDINGNALAGENFATGDKVLAYNSSAVANQAFTFAELQAGIAGATNLNDLADVDATVAGDGDVLVHDGSTWTKQKVYYLHTQGSAATTWTVTHSLGQKYCNVTVVDGSDEVIIPQSITFDSTTQLTVTFNSAITGKVVVMGVA